MLSDHVAEIQTVARRLAELQSSPERLYDAVRKLDRGTAQALMESMKADALAARPVVLLRYEILRRVVAGESVDEEVTERIRDAIVRQDPSIFTDYQDGFSERLEAANIKSNVFKTWLVPFRLFYSFFYSGKHRERIPILLEEISKRIKTELSIESHAHNSFSFDGPTNFGATSCWLAIFPMERETHKNAHQLFAEISPEDIGYGLMPGNMLEGKSTPSIHRCTDLQEATDYFRNNIERYIELNHQLSTVWKWALGPREERWEDFYKNRTIAINSDANVGDLHQYATGYELAQRLGVEAPYSSRNRVQVLTNFRDAAIGDIVVAIRGDREVVGVGVIEGAYEYDAARTEYWHVRKTKWIVSTELRFDRPMFRLDAFSPTLHWGQVKTRLLEQHPELADKLSEIEARARHPIHNGHLHSKQYTRDQAIAESGLDASTFDEHWAVLQDKRQVVLQGPPGTGKSYLADIYGRLLSHGDTRYMEVVQFHPSYSYEDFVEGYRPATGGGLELREGIFKRICDQARTSGAPTVLVIDEINRGDLSKIFGELLYLLEYRDKQITLTYNPKSPFDIPPNLYLIGTMNTADRSLALIDYALRRRFSFISLEPQYELVKRLVKSTEVDIELLVRNFERMNQDVAANPSLGREFQVGHSYLLRHRDLTVSKLRQVWRFDIEPLLREYYFDAPEQLPRLRNMFFDGISGA